MDNSEEFHEIYNRINNQQMINISTDTSMQACHREKSL